MSDDADPYPVEVEAAWRVEQLMRREFGLSPTASAAELRGSVLRVILKNAVSPMGRAIAQAEGGTTALNSVYQLLHDVNRDQMHHLVSCLLSAPVQQSAIQVDFCTADIFVTFYLAGQSRTSPSFPVDVNRHSSGTSPDMAHSCLK